MFEFQNVITLDGIFSVPFPALN